MFCSNMRLSAGASDADRFMVPLLVRLEDNVAMLHKYDHRVTKKGAKITIRKDRKRTGVNCKSCKRRIKERSRPNADRCAAVDAARKMGVSSRPHCASS